MIYAAQFATMNALLSYLTENCCEDADECSPPANKRSKRRKARQMERVS
jgi:hypothetical protein